MAATVHLVYPAGPRLATPDAIGRELSERLAERFRVQLYPWDGFAIARPRTGDYLLGHPHPTPHTTFRRSMGQAGWRRRVILAPFCPAEEVYAAYLAAVVPKCDEFLAICGSHWFEQTSGSIFAAWLPRMSRLDLAVNRQHFPRVKAAFCAPGRRRFLYIGNDGPPKNLSFLDRLAGEFPTIEFGWIGPGTSKPRFLRRHGQRDFATAEARKLVATHDFLITVGLADANPTTVLEAMAWGLVPVCTRESGYSNIPGIVNIDGRDLENAKRTIEFLERAPSSELETLRATNDQALDGEYSWNYFAAKVEAALVSERVPPPLPPTDVRSAVRLRLRAALSPYSPIRPQNIATTILREYRRRRKEGAR